MTPPRTRAAFYTCLAIEGAGVCALTIAARRGEPPSTIAVGLALCFVPYAGALILARSIESASLLRRIAVFGSLVLGAVLVLAPPALSDDLYRYLWEGRLWLEGINPYRVPPDDPSLAHLRDALWAPINNKPLGSIYPPLSQLLFVAAAALGGQIWSVKVLALLAHVCAVVIVARVSERPRAALALGLNPLLLGESALNGHFDVLVGAALFAAAWALGSGRFVRAGAATCAAVGLKVVGLVALPWMWPRRKALAVTALFSALLLAPLVWSRTPDDPASGTGQFAARWRGNESVFALVDWVSGQLFADPMAETVSRAIVVVLLVFVIALAMHRRAPPVSAIRAVVWAVLLLSPQVHPWYLAWLLPLEAAVGARVAWVWSFAILAAYAPLDRWVAEGVWEMPLSLQILEYLVVAAAWISDPRRPTLSGAPSDRQIQA